MREFLKPITIKWQTLLALFILLIVFCLPLRCQNARFDGVVQAQSGFPAPGALIAVCNQPCTVPASPTFSNLPSPLTPLCSSASDNTCTSPNPVTADGVGNYSFYLKPGKYTVVFFGSGLTPRTQVDQIFPCDPSNCSLSGNITVTGTLNALGGGSLQGTFTSGPSYTISTVTETGNVVTVTTATPCTAITAANQSIMVSGVGVAGYNSGPTGLVGFATASACVGSSFTYFNPTSGLGNSSGGTVTVSPIFSQGLTHTGPETVSGQLTITNNNQVFWAGPGATPTIDQAVSACGTNPCYVEIAPTYTGPESANLLTMSTGHKVYSGALNVTIIDRRFNTLSSQPNYPVLYGSRLAGQLVRMGVNGWSSSPADSTGASTSINWVTGTMPTNGGAQNGSVSVVLSHDTVNVGTGNVPWVGQDGECDITATVFDFPVNNCYGVNGQANIVRANGAQSIINAVGQHAAANSNISSAGAQMINSYGTLNEAQAAGVGRNYSEYNRGNVLFDTETQIHSLITGANVTISAATETGQIVTITTVGVCTFTTNQEVLISGVTPAAYNGRYFVRTPGCNGGSTFTYFHPTSASLGAGTIFGIVNGYTPTSTSYFRSINRIDLAPLSDTVGWLWTTIAGGSAFRVIPASLITSFLPHEFTTRIINDEVAAPSGSGTQDLLWGDSTAHRFRMNNNNGGAVTVGTMPVYTSNGTEQLGTPHVVQDTCTLGTNCGVTFSGSAAFTSSSSYHCSASDATAANAVRVNQTAGNAVTFTGTGTDVISYVCAGN